MKKEKDNGKEIRLYFIILVGIALAIWGGLHILRFMGWY